jgi:hypothetical protein
MLMQNVSNSLGKTNNVHRRLKIKMINIYIHSLTATAFANEKISPMAPPKPGPSDRLIRKYAPPPFTSPFVQIAQQDRAVIVVTREASSTMVLPSKIPA